MNVVHKQSHAGAEMLEILSFQLDGREFCVLTTAIREIRGWDATTPIPHAPTEVTGVMNLRGIVIPIIDLALKLGMPAMVPTERSAIVVAEIHGAPIGLIVDSVSDILSIDAALLQPMPDMNVPGGATYADGIFAKESGLICFLNLGRMFETAAVAELAA